MPQHCQCCLRRGYVKVVVDSLTIKFVIAIAWQSRRRTYTPLYSVRDCHPDYHRDRLPILLTMASSITLPPSRKQLRPKASRTMVALRVGKRHWRFCRRARTSVGQKIPACGSERLCGRPCVQRSLLPTGALVTLAPQSNSPPRGD